MGAFKVIRDRLADECPGSIPPEHVRDIETLLADCWDRLSGARREGMRGYKLVGRTEDMSWQPPVLTFGLERHGALVNGSTRAEVQMWRVDLTQGTADLAATRSRQKLPMDARLNVKPLAAEIAALIGDGRADPRLKWRGADQVRVVLGEVIPTTIRRTTSNRRKRFAAELERLLAPVGWRRREAGTQMAFERAGEG